MQDIINLDNISTDNRAKLFKLVLIMSMSVKRLYKILQTVLSLQLLAYGVTLLGQYTGFQEHTIYFYLVGFCVYFFVLAVAVDAILVAVILFKSERRLRALSPLTVALLACVCIALISYAPVLDWVGRYSRYDPYA